MTDTAKEAQEALDRVVPQSAGWGPAVRIDGLAYQVEEARAIARRLADEGRPMLGWTDGGLPLVRFIDAMRAFDALPWAKEEAA
jgi:hypothetical protein